MPDITADGKIRVAWVTSIANIAAPTAGELNAGILLHSTMTADGLAGFRPETAAVSTSALDTTFDTNVNGRTSFSGTMLRFKKQTGTDTIYDTLVKDTAGFIVVRQSITAATAWATAQKVRVYPALCGEVAHIDVEPNSLERYEVPIQISAAPNLRAAVA